MKKLFIIEEEVDLCSLMRSYFLRKNHQVYIAHTLEEAMPRIRELQPQIIILNAALCNNLQRAKQQLSEAAPGVQIWVAGQQNFKELQL